MKKVIKDTPITSVSLRRYEKPSSIEGRELVKKVCLSLGLLQPGDSRDVIVDILHVMLKEKKDLSSQEIMNLAIASREQHKLSKLGIAHSNVRRQIRRLRELFLVEKKANVYRINENAKMKDIFEEKIEKLLLPSIHTRIKEYLELADKEFLS